MFSAPAVMTCETSMTPLLSPLLHAPTPCCCMLLGCHTVTCVLSCTNVRVHDYIELTVLQTEESYGIIRDKFEGIFRFLAFTIYVPFLSPHREEVCHHHR